MRIKKAAVLGAGVMGSQIAVQIARAGIHCLLLDVLPLDLTAEDKAGGPTLELPAARNRVAWDGLDKMKKAMPSGFCPLNIGDLISVGNFVDDLRQLRNCDWIVEAVVEEPEIKRSLLAQVEPHLHREAIVSSNTSGIPLAILAEGRPEHFRRRFLGAHFFNPPHYLPLLELVPTSETAGEVITFMFDFCNRVLGKGVVIAKDTPNFIANRIGTFALMDGIKVMLENGYTVEEVDALTGRIIGRTISASLRTVDLVGLDTVLLVANNIYALAVTDEKRATFSTPELLRQMVMREMLGDKTNGGFFKRDRGRALTLDLQKFEYRMRREANFPSLEVAKKIKSVSERLPTLVYADDRAGAYLWRTLSETLVYAANRVPEIVDTIVEIDNAMKWGFGHELGIFEMWDAIGLERSVSHIRAEGRPIPINVEQMLAAGYKSFYKSEHDARRYFDFQKGEYRLGSESPGTGGIKLIKKIDV